MDKHFIAARDLLRDSFRLAHRIYKDRYRPEIIIGVWRGGTPVAIAVHEYFRYRGSDSRHFPVKAASYTGIEERTQKVELGGVREALELITPRSTVLLVDDVFDSGLTMERLLKQVREGIGDVRPESVRVACPWYKPARNQVRFPPDYYIHETDDWLVFPHELQGLDMDEIRRGKSDLVDLFDDLDLN